MNEVNLIFLGEKGPNITRREKDTTVDRLAFKGRRPRPKLKAVDDSLSLRCFEVKASLKEKELEYF